MTAVKLMDMISRLLGCAGQAADAVSTNTKKAAVDKEWEKLEKIPAWQLTKVRNKKEVFAEASKKVHFASLMDISHLKNSELET